MGNQQLYNLDNKTLQVLLSGKLGDGHFIEYVNGYSFHSNCIHKEYIDFKTEMLEKRFVVNTNSVINRGFKQTMIHNLYTRSYPEIKLVHQLSIEETLNMLDDFGLALWLYDDGTLHQEKSFYNLCTHSFPKELQLDVIIPKLKEKWDITCNCVSEKKKDGRVFWYLNISKYHGSYVITKILEKVPFKCFEYKLWSSTTIQKWSKFQEELKSRDTSKFKDLRPRQVAAHYARIWEKINKEDV
jgi:hypothetical protein